MAAITAEAKLLFAGGGKESAFGPRARARSMPGLREQRRDRKHCDVAFGAPDGADIWAHRFVLSAEYSGCRDLFAATDKVSTSEDRLEGQQRVPRCRVMVTDLNSDMLQLLIDSAYCAPLEGHVGFHNVRQVLDLAEKLEISSIRRHCLQMLRRNLAPDTCVGIYQLAASKGYSVLAAEAFRHLVDNFAEAWKDSPDFHSLRPHEMRTILADNRLNAPDEVEDTFRAILKWVSADVAERWKYLAQLLPLVRFVQCTTREYETVITDPQVLADEASVEVLNVVHQTLSQKSMVVRECAGVDLSAKTWLTPRLPKGVIFVFGGWGDILGEKVSNSMCTYNYRTRSWRSLGEQDTVARIHHGVAVLGSSIYIVGGSDGRRQYHSVACFDVNRNQWSQKANMAIGRSYVTVAVLQGLIYAIGGECYHFLDTTGTVERYDPKANQWSRVASMSQARCSAASAVARGRIYVIGGRCKFQMLNTVDCYDPCSDVWTQVATMPTPRSSAWAVAHGHMIYVIGGSTNTALLASMEQFDTRRVRFTDLPSMNECRIGFTAALLEGYIYLIGGRKAPADGPWEAAPLERYDIKARRWHVLDKQCPVDYFSTACVVFDVESPERYV